MINETIGVFKTQQLEPLEMNKARYIMAADGIYYEQNDDLFHASTLVKEFYNPLNFGTMPIQKGVEFFEARFPKIPQQLIEECLGFFEAVEAKTGWECGLVLLYDPDSYEYSWCCPDQKCSKWDLEFKTPVPGKDYDENLIHFGDVHLHPAMSAYHSGTDHKDEMTASDGLHLVVGTPREYSRGHWDDQINKYVYDDEKRKPTECCAVFVTEGNRFTCDPGLVLEGTNFKPGKFPKEWMKKCKEATRNQFSYGV